MRSSSRARSNGFCAALGLTALAALGGCGNYSNDDLEYIGAFPDMEDVSMETPLTVTVRPALQDDALQTTIKLTTAVNASAAAIVGFIDRIRTSLPNAHEQDARVWGPFPDQNNPGWQDELRMRKGVSPNDGVTPRFTYDLVMIAPAGVNFGTAEMPRAETPVLTGWFESAGRAHKGLGQVALMPAEARDTGHAVLKDLEKLESLTIAYDNRAWPRTLAVTVVNEPPLVIDVTMDAQSAKYQYQRAEDGSGAMDFTFVQDLVKGPLGVDTLDVNARWLGTGAGQLTTSVLAGDHQNSSWVDCWDASGQTVYNSGLVTGIGSQAACVVFPDPTP